MSMTSHFIRNPDITIREVDDVAFLVHPETDALYHLNPLGTALWRLLKDGVSEEDAIEIICMAFPEADEKAVKMDIGALLTEFDDHNLVIRLGV